MKTYSEKLRDPRWQKKRLEIMQRDEFSCRICHDDKSPLNVHHSYYEKGLEPWEYSDDMLTTLCETHHAEVEQLKRWFSTVIKDEIGFAGALAFLRRYQDHPSETAAVMHALEGDTILSLFKVLSTQFRRGTAYGKTQ